MRIGEQCYIDPRTCDDEEELEGESRIQVLKQGNARKRLCIARYINDSINPAGYNVEFQKFPMPCPYPPRLPYTDSASPSSDLSCPFPYALVRARRRIECGEELFVNYGRWYWASAGLEQPSLGAPGSPGMRTQTVKLSVPYRIPFLELHALRTKAVEAATRGVHGLADVTAEL